MSKRKILLFGLSAFVLILLGITPAILQFAGEQSLIKLRERGVKVNAEGINGFLFGIGAESIEGWIPVSSQRGPTLPIQVRVDNFTGRILVPLLPPGLPKTELRATVYGGEVTAETPLLSSSNSISLDARKVDLSLHPQLRALGIEDGKVSINFKDHPSDLKWVSRTSYHIELESLRFSPPSSIRSLIAVNEVSDGSIRADISAAPSGEISIDSAEFDSSIATGKISGTAQMGPRGELVVNKGIIKVDLNRPDSAKLSTWLPLITNRRVSSEAQSFSCSFRATSCEEASDARIGSFCLKAICN